jgi:UDP-sugar transporter A1/2/3
LFGLAFFFILLSPSNLADTRFNSTPQGNTKGNPHMSLNPNVLKYGALVALVVQTTSAVILTRASKIGSPGAPPPEPYSSTTLVIMAELTKLVASMLLVYFVDLKDITSHSSRVSAFVQSMYSQNFERPSESLKLAVPAALYTLQNNLIYVALANLEATTFQVGYQMKVVTTAVLSSCILQRNLSPQKWVAIILLTLGIILTQLQGGGVDTASGQQDFAVGLGAVIVCGCSSALAGVYFEKILKGTAPSVWMRNSQLAFFSSLFGFVGMTLFDNVPLRDFFRGYTPMVWSIVAVQALGGLIVAVVVKYADNILKGFATALSIVVCGLTSMQLFGFMPSELFFMGSVVVIVATMLYSRPDPPLKAPLPVPDPVPVVVVKTDKEAE